MRSLLAIFRDIKNHTKAAEQPAIPCLCSLSTPAPP
jgi:hypothetical protein